MSFKQLFLAVITVLVGGFSLADIWAGFISACISALIVLRVFKGSNFAIKITLFDVLIWVLGVFVSMRCWSIINQFITVDFFKKDAFNDVVVMGLATGTINTYLYIKNYDPIKKLIEKYLK
jgi:hypothetical protein